MALIDCYECGKKVSDTAVACPHCGFPINGFITYEKAEKNKKRIEEKNKQKQISIENKKKQEQLAKEKEEALKQKLLAEIRCHECNRVIGEVAVCPHCGFNMLEYRKKTERQEQLRIEAEKKEKLEQELLKEKARQEQLEFAKKPVECPMCGSKNIGVVNRGFSLIWGFAGSGSARNVCQKCGYRWKPGRPDRYS